MDQRPTFSLAYTSVRAEAIPDVIRTWTERAFTDDLEWIVTVDEGDEKCFNAVQTAFATLPTKISRTVRTNTGPRTSTAGWNLAADNSTGKVIIAVADDFIPPVGWAPALLDIKPEGWIDGEYVVHTEDGYVHNLCVLVMLTRKRYERYGYMLYPGYLSLFSDTEFTEVAYRDGVVLDAKHLLFEHVHCDCKKRAKDEHDEKHASTERWNAGEALFRIRRSNGFPVDMGPKAITCENIPVVESIGNAEQYAAYLQVIRDDLCLYEVCSRLADEGVQNIFFSEPTEYWSGEPVEEEYKHELEAVANQLAELGLRVHRKQFDVKKRQVPGDNRLCVETRVRNDSLRWIRASGFEDILVVDGDELWMKNTLSLIHPHVKAGVPSLSLRMIPVIGLPGLPVDNAQDVAVAYVGKNVVFRECRSPMRYQQLPWHRIFHFTGTRRTMEETVQKHKRSGHYDDPDYLFEEWINEVLPNIKLGYKHKWSCGHEGLHMFKKYQIWNSLRAWKKSELNDIPQSIHKYLSTETITD